MKLFILLLSFLSCISPSSYTQVVVATEVIQPPTEALFANIQSKYLRHFNRSFKNIRDPRYSVNTDGFSIKFTDNKIQHDVRYNKRGKWLLTLRYIPVEQLSRRVVYAVSHSYKNYNIFFAQELSVPSGKVYFVKIEKGNEWKFLKLYDGEIEVLGEYVRN